MEPNESIYNIYILGSSLLFSELDSLGKKIINEKMVGKFLRSLPRAWEPKVTTIKEAKNLKTLNFDEFIDSFIAHEGKIKKLKVEDNNVKRKSLTLKAVNDNEEKNIYNGEEYEDKTLIARNFSKYLRLKKYGANRRSFRREKGDRGESNNQDVIICYECEKLIHVKYDCPNIKKKIKI